MQTKVEKKMNRAPEFVDCREQYQIHTNEKDFARVTKEEIHKMQLL